MLKELEFAKELLGSPWLLVLIVAAMIFAPTLHNWYTRRQKCSYCGKGTLREAESEVIDTVHHSNTQHSSSNSRVKVTYRCTACGR